MNGCNEQHIGAWLDGELGAGEVAALARHLAGCAACRETLADLAALRAGIAAIEDPVPPALAARIEAMIDQSARTRRPVAPWLAAAAVGWAVAASVMLAVRPSAHTAAELTAVRDAALRPAAGVIAAAYDPDGYQLISSRLDEVAGHQARVFIYQRGTQRVALCEWDANGEAAHAVRQVVWQGSAINYWNDGKTEFWATGGDELAHFTAVVHARI